MTEKYMIEWATTTEKHYAIEVTDQGLPSSVVRAFADGQDLTTDTASTRAIEDLLVFVEGCEETPLSLVREVHKGTVITTAFTHDEHLRALARQAGNALGFWRRNVGTDDAMRAAGQMERALEELINATLDIKKGR